MADQAKSVDYRARDAKRIGSALQAVLDEVLAIIDACHLVRPLVRLTPLGVVKG